METIKLDLIPGKKMPSLHASQYDDGRDYHIDLTENRVPYTLDGTETISLTVRKCDNTLVTMDIANTFADKSYIEFRTTEQMNACAGFNYGEITIEKNGTQISSLNFYLQVEGAPDEGGIQSQSEINNLNRQIDDHLDDVLPDAIAEEVPPIVEQVVGENYYDKETSDNTFATKTALEEVASDIPTKTSELNNDSDFAQINDSSVSSGSVWSSNKVNDIKTVDAFDRGKISKFVSTNFILGRTWEQGAMLNINKWSEMTTNSASNRVHMSITLNVDVSAIHIEVAQGYKYQFAFFDNTNTQRAKQTTWATDSFDVYAAEKFHTLRIMVARNDDADLTDASYVVNIYDNSVGTLAGAMSTKYGILLVNNNDEYALKVDTTAKTIKVSNSYLLSHLFQRQTITGATISYDIGSSTASKALVLDMTDNTLKVVYCLDGNVSPKFDAEKHLVIAYFMANTILANGYINTLCSYNIDDTYYGNKPRKTSGGSEQANNAKLKVCSYNLGMYTDGYSSTTVTAEMQADIIAHSRAFFSKYDCDILGLQENRTSLYDVTVNNAIYNYLYTHSEDVSNWTCIKTRREFISSGHGIFTAESRDYTYGTININGIDVFLMSVHFSLTPEHRATDWSELLAILAQHEYFIVCGDFNAGNGGGTAQDEFNNAINLGYHAANGGYLGLMQTLGNSVKCYDNIITSSNIVIRNSYVPDVFASMDSDHLPVIAELEIV